MPKLVKKTDADEFREMAEAIAGKKWRTRLPPMIGKCRTQVWEYGLGRRQVPSSVKRLMRVLIAVKDDEQPERKA